MIANTEQQRGPYNVVMDVDPPQSFRWLEGNTHNRPVNWHHVERLARDMRAGRWLLTHQGIAFDTTGLLIDGQHRLWAVIEADVTVQMRVFFNEPPHNRQALDTGERRSNLHVLSITGEVGKVSTATLATLRAMLAGTKARPTRRTPSEEAEQLARHRRAVEFSLEHFTRANVAGIATAEIRAVIARAYYSGNHDRLARFCSVLRSGLGDDLRDHVVLALRNYLMQRSRGQGSHTVRRNRYGKAEWCLAAFLDGKTPSRIATADGELFPLPEEAARAG